MFHCVDDEAWLAVREEAVGAIKLIHVATLKLHERVLAGLYLAAAPYGEVIGFLNRV